MSPDDVGYEPISFDDALKIAQFINVTMIPVGETVPLSDLDATLFEQCLVEYGGITDPIGQLSAWLADQLSKFSSWITSAVGNIIQQAFKGVQDFVWNILSNFVKTVTDAFQKFIVTPVQNFISGAADFLTKTLPSAIQSAIQGLQQGLQPITGLITNITNSIQQIPNMITSAIQGITSVIQAIPGQIQSVIQGITSALAGIPGQIQSVIGGISARLQSTLGGLSGLAQNILNTIMNIPSAVGNILQSIGSSLGSIVGNITSQIRNIADTVFTSIQKLPETVGKTITDIITGIQKGLQDVAGRIGDALQKAWSGIEPIFKQIQETIKDFPSALPKMIGEAQKFLWEHIPDFLRNFLETAPKLLEQAGQNITGFINAIMKFPEWFPRWFSENIAKPITDALEKIGKFIWENLPKDITNFINWVSTEFSKAWKNFTDWITKDVPNFFKWLKDEAWKSITDLPSNVGKFIWDHLPESVKNAFKWISETFSKTWDNIVNFFTKDVPGFFDWLKKEGWKALTDLPSNIGKFIWEHLPDNVKNFIKWLDESLRGVWDQLVNFFTKDVPGFFGWIKDQLGNIWDMLQKHVKPFFEKIWNFITNPEERDKMLGEIWDALKGFWDKYIQPAFQWVWDVITKGVIPQIVSRLKAIAEIPSLMWKAGASIIEGAKQSAMDIGNWIAGFVQDFALGPIKATWDKLYEKMREALSKPVSPGAGEWSFLLTTNLAVIGSLVGLRLLGGYLGAFANMIPDDWTVTLGVVGHPDVKFTFKPAWFLKELSRVIFQEPRKILSYFLEWQVFWFSRAYSRPLNAIFKDVLPIELPSPSETIQLMKRALGSNLAPALIDYYKKILAMYGFSSFIISLMSARVWREGGKLQSEYIPCPPEYIGPLTDFTKAQQVIPYVTYTDRFGNERVMPLSLMYTIPDEDTLAYFMVRDIFKEYKDFLAVMKARGVFEDTAHLWYLARYRYPSMEKLWEFFCRAHANLLWYEPTEEIIRDSKDRAEAVGAYIPLPPTAFNIPSSTNPSQLSDTILTAISTYARWWDYAPFSWIPDFTADEYIWLDLMADIPLRVDARWMYKWRVFSALTKQLDWLKVPSGFDPDAFGLGTVVIARGMHPKFALPVTIAEQMNALTDERTLFRTGIMYAFRYNALTPDLMNKLLGGLFTLDLGAPVWDANRKIFTWQTFTVPVRFLEGEAKLLELRALYDKSNTALSALQRTLLTMASDNYFDPKEYPKKVEEIVGIISKAVGEQAKALGLEKGYAYKWDATLNSVLETNAILLNAHQTLRRLRYWLRWSLYQLWARFMKGHISDKEIDEFVETIGKELRLTDYEKKFFVDIAKFFRDIYRREMRADYIIGKLRRGEIKRDQALAELDKLGIDRQVAEAMIDAKIKTYVPSIQTLATLCEYVPEAVKLLPKVLDATGVPEDEREYWTKYVMRKPVMDEVRRLVTELIADYAQGKITDAEWKTYMDKLKEFGYTDAEIEIITTIAKLRAERARKRAG